MRFAEGSFGLDTGFSSRVLAQAPDVIPHVFDAQLSVLSPFSVESNYDTVIVVNDRMPVDTAIEVAQVPQIVEKPIVIPAFEPATTSKPRISEQGETVLLRPDVPLFVRSISVFPTSRPQEVVLQEMKAKSDPNAPEMYAPLDNHVAARPVHAATQLMPVITVAEKYIAHQRNVGYLESQKQSFGGASVSGTVVGETGFLFWDERTNQPMVQVRTYVLNEPGNMQLKRFAAEEGFIEQIRYDKKEYIVPCTISLDDAVRYGYVFSAFEVANREQKIA